MNSTEKRHLLKETTLSKVKTLLPYLLLVGALLIFIVYLWQNIDRYQELFNLSISTLIILITLVIVTILINGAINYFFYRALGAILNFNEGVGLAAVNTLANQLPFAGGFIAKGAYLKRGYRLSYSHFLSSTMALYICFVSVNGFVALAVLGSWFILSKEEVSPVLALAFFGMASSVILIWLPLELISLPDMINKWFVKLEKGWSVLRQNKQLVVVMMGLQLLLTLVVGARFWLSFRALSQEITYAQCLLFSSATILTRLVSISPGGLGVRESLVAAIGALLGFSPGVSAVAVGFDRLVSTTVIILLGSFYSYILGKKINDNSNNAD
jgi:uncharacterized membrane protein YbhN (UPF0104 family)